MRQYAPSTMIARAVAALLVVMLFAGGLGHPQDADADDEEPYTVPRQIAAQNVPGDLIDGNNTFAFDLYQALRIEDGNLIFSPYSVSTALAMTYAGARDTTAQQMAETMHFTLPQDDLHAAFGALEAALSASGEGEEDFRLSVANAIWGQEGYSFLPEFTSLLEDNYRAGLQTVDFESAPEPARQQINQWVSDATQQRIEELLAAGDITEATRLVLTNAIYFKGVWLFPFSEGATSDAPFTLLDGSEVTVPMMFKGEHFDYAAGDGYQALRIWYKPGQMSMIVLLPDEGRFEEIESALDKDLFDSLRGDLASQQVMLFMPRFKYESGFNLTATLAAMGMPEAFGSQADFSGMTGEKDLFIDLVKHKAFISLDENGTEAAAATAVAMKAGAAPSPEEPVEFRVDRPFIYLITDEATGAILFVGRVLDPTA
ncbi:MAG: serpin family protein [Anaerolineae bacterium]|nr:serpin family protein [Anaerolineae bacterium]